MTKKTSTKVAALLVASLLASTSSMEAVNLKTIIWGGATAACTIISAMSFKEASTPRIAKAAYDEANENYPNNQAHAGMHFGIGVLLDSMVRGGASILAIKSGLAAIVCGYMTYRSATEPVENS